MHAHTHARTHARTHTHTHARMHAHTHACTHTHTHTHVSGNQLNGRAFRDAGGDRCAVEMANYKKPRRMALRIVTQLILLEGIYTW